MLKLKFKRLVREAILPAFAHGDDFAFDLFSLEDKELAPGERGLFKTGWAAELPAGYHVIIKPRSGLALKAGIDVLAGVIDGSYRGEWGVMLINLGQEICRISKGDRIAQGIILAKPEMAIVEAEELAKTARGGGGFGSTGR